MRWRLLIATVALVLIVMGGCLGSDEGTAAETLEQAESEDRTVQQDKETERNQTEDEETDTVKSLEIPFEERGHFTAMTAICQGVNGYSCEWVVGPDNQRLFPIDPQGDVRSANLTLTWDAQSPMMNELRLSLFWSCEEACEEHRFEDGTSPVELSVDDIEEAGEVHVSVWVPPQVETPWPAYVGVYQVHPQDFHIEGTFTTLTTDADDPRDAR